MTQFATVLEIINDAAAAIGEYDAGEAMTDDILQQSLRRLNDLLDSWSTYSQAVYQITPTSFTLTAGLGTYTLGPSADLNVSTRPPWIEYAYTLINNVSYGIELIGAQEYADIFYKPLGGIPVKCWLNLGVPTNQIYLWPVPLSAWTLVLGLPQTLTEFTATSTTLAMPPGYQRALVFNLAQEIAPLLGREVTATVARIASVALGNMKRLNRDRRVMRIDVGSLRDGWSLANVYSGQGTV